MRDMAVSAKVGRGEPIRNAILIAGPTASGKSAYALERAENEHGAIVNCDSMQVYSVLHVLTARPSATETQIVPHHLYGYVHPSQSFSTGQWMADVTELLESGALEDRRPIFVGGTGLYFRALLGGLSQMPKIPDSLRTRLRAELSESGSVRLHKELNEKDPAAAASINPGDPQRVLRALEVFEASGRSILEWQKERTPPLVDELSAQKYLILPDRAVLHRRLEQRLDRMIDLGALAEIAALGQLGIDPAMPAMKAIGVPQLLAAADGAVDLEIALKDAKTATRQYAKRQMTWFRNQLDDNWVILTGQPE